MSSDFAVAFGEYKPKAWPTAGEERPWDPEDDQGWEKEHEEKYSPSGSEQGYESVFRQISRVDEEARDQVSDERPESAVLDCLPSFGSSAYIS